MKKQVAKFFLLFFLFSSYLYAQSVEDAVTKAHRSNINALLIFTSQDGLNTGLFHFTKIGVNMEVYNLPLMYHFSSDSAFNYFLVGNIGYSRVFLSGDVIIPPNSRLNYDNHLRTYTAGLGGGVRYKFNKELSALGGAELIYSRSGASVKQPDDDLGNAIEDFFNKEYNDNLSYKLFLEAEYQTKMGFLRPYTKFNYKFFDTKSDFSFDSFSSFKTQSSLFSLSVGSETDKLYSYYDDYLTLEGYLNATYLNGAVVESVQFDNYTKVGAIAYWYTKNAPAWIERFFVEASSVSSDGLEGYNFGVGFSIDY